MVGRLRFLPIQTIPPGSYIELPEQWFAPKNSPGQRHDGVDFVSIAMNPKITGQKSRSQLLFEETLVVCRVFQAFLSLKKHPFLFVHLVLNVIKSQLPNVWFLVCPLL